jgi:histidyl-tRNA synthetase
LPADPWRRAARALVSARRPAYEAANRKMLMTDAKPSLVKARLPRGFVDRGPDEIGAVESMLAGIRESYELFGFEAVETPAVEFTEALGKFLPDQDRPNAGVFSFQDDDEQWLSLRYDLTAPLARYFAENFDQLPKPYRSYRSGLVFRNEKPGPGRFRQFMQFDADTIGSASPAADAELCMMAADTLEKLGIARGDYVLKINNRKILDGVLDVIGLGAEDDDQSRLVVLRAIDKLDRLGAQGVRALLGAGRKDESGDFTKGANLSPDAIEHVIAFTEAKRGNNSQTLEALAGIVASSARGLEGVEELRAMDALAKACGYNESRLSIDPSVVRGLEYYTGPVFEAELTFTALDDKGQPIRFGSIGGGGRYDGLVARFRGESVPATGFSIGVSRLFAALKAIDSPVVAAAPHGGPVVVLVMDRDHLAHYQTLVGQLREAGVRAELYLGASGMKAQMKYADRRKSPCVIIQGSNERERGEVQIKDLIEGAQASQAIGSNVEWKAARPAQISATEQDMVASVKEILGRHGL